MTLTDAFGDALPVEVGDLFQEVIVFHDRRPAVADGAQVLVVGNRVPLAGGEVAGGISPLFAGVCVVAISGCGTAIAWFYVFFIHIRVRLNHCLPAPYHISCINIFYLQIDKIYNAKSP